MIRYTNETENVQRLNLFGVGSHYKLTHRRPFSSTLHGLVGISDEDHLLKDPRERWRQLVGFLDVRP